MSISKESMMPEAYFSLSVTLALSLVSVMKLSLGELGKNNKRMNELLSCPFCVVIKEYILYIFFALVFLPACMSV